MTLKEYQKILSRIEQLLSKAQKTKLSQSEANELKHLLEKAEEYEEQFLYQCAK